MTSNNMHLIWNKFWSIVWYHSTKLYLLNNERIENITVNKLFYNRRPILSSSGFLMTISPANLRYLSLVLRECQKACPGNSGFFPFKLMSMFDKFMSMFDKWCLRGGPDCHLHRICKNHWSCWRDCWKQHIFLSWVLHFGGKEPIVGRK